MSGCVEVMLSTPARSDGRENDSLLETILGPSH